MFSTMKSQIPMNGLIAYYKLELNGDDFSANGNDGTIYGNIVGAKDRFGNEEGALFFDGVSNYIEVLDAQILNVTDEITISVWINPSDISDEGFTALINKWEDTPGSGGKGYYLGLNPSGFNVRWNTGSVSADGALVPLNEWTHILVTYSADSLKIYRNCQLEISSPAVDSIQPTSVPLKIGIQSQFVGSSQYYDGIMDEVLIYDRELLLHEIQDICSSTTLTTGLKNKDEVFIYPSPFNDYLNILTLGTQYTSAEIINMTGEVVVQINKFQSPQRISTANLYEGFYILRLYTKQGNFIVKKMVKK